MGKRWVMGVESCIREREREKASSEKMRTKNGFRFSQRERESFIRKEKMRTENGFPERERELYQRERK